MIQELFRRSALHVIQLAVLCKVPDLQSFGYERVLGPLVQDIRTLEQEGVFIESLGQSVQGTLLCVAADNLARSEERRGGKECLRMCSAGWVLYPI